jgi:two-component system chemotaxis sensor kinase CheA
MEAALLDLEHEPGPDYAEQLNALFRTAHTIKGSAGLFAFDAIVRFTHALEDLLDRLRARCQPAERGLIDLLLDSHDHLVQLVDATRDGQTVQADPHLIARLQYAAGQLARGLPISAGAHPSVEIEEPGMHLVRSDYWHLSLRFGADVMRNGLDPLAFIRHLRTLGRIVSLTTLDESLPSSEAFDPETCYLGFEIDLEAACDKQTIENVFDFVREDSTIRIVPPHAKIAEYIRLIEGLPEGAQRLGEILVQGGALTPAELDEVLELQAAREAAGTPTPIGTLLVEEQLAPAPAVAAALDRQRQDSSGRKVQRVIKIDAVRLDALIDLVGELVIASATSQLVARRSAQAALIESVSVLSGLVERVRDEALGLRMVPIGDIFGRFPRLVRDTAAELGKAITLELQGTDTELDRGMVETLAEPLTHLVRNALDHGIEPVAVRRARGKPDTGRVWLDAFHESGSVVIEIGDDGGGIDRERVRARAIERGLIGTDERLSETELMQLLFEPGFSTCDTVTNLSGRGVGLDVVKRQIERLKGRVDVESVAGEGTVFRLRLPLTLAIIDGFEVKVGDTTLVIPLDMVIECLDLRAETLVPGRHYLDLRGEVLPFVRLRDVFEIQGPPPTRENVVVVQYGQERAGLVVDSLHGELQAVIKPLGHLFRGLRGLGGSTILGNGAVALIVDIPELIQLAGERDQRHTLPQAGHQAFLA